MIDAGDARAAIASPVDDLLTVFLSELIGRSQRDGPAVGQTGTVARVLVVDDETAVRDWLSRTLRFEGYQVGVAARFSLDS